jgi:hypothetical protein
MPNFFHKRAAPFNFVLRGNAQLQDWREKRKKKGFELIVSLRRFWRAKWTKKQTTKL